MLKTCCRMPCCTPSEELIDPTTPGRSAPGCSGSPPTAPGRRVPTVAPSLEFADCQVLTALDGLETAPRPLWTVRSPIRWAAAVLAAVALTARVGSRNSGRPDQPPRPRVLVCRPLDEALAKAASATLELAKAATGPAGRVSCRMFDAATVPDLPTKLAASPEVLRAVGGRVGSEVRPLSETAREAFSFLLAEAT